MEVQDVLVAESASLSRFEAYYTALEDEAREDADSDEHEVSELYERKEDHACSLSDAEAKSLKLRASISHWTHPI